MTAAFYSVVQYVPSVIRDESMNVGVIVAMPAAEYFDFDFHTRKTRLGHLSSEFKPQLLEAFESRLRERLGPWEQKIVDAWQGHLPVNGSSSNSTAALDGEEADAEIWAAADRTESVLSLLAGEYAGSVVRLSPFRYVEMRAESAMIEQGATLLNDLMNQFVRANRKKQSRGPYRTTPYQAFKKYLKTRDLLSRDPESGVSPHFKYEIQDGRELEFEFGALNGVAHVFETIDIEDPDITDSLTRRVVGDSLLKFSAARASEESVKTYSVLAATPESEDQIRKEISPLKAVSSIFNILDQAQADALESIIKGIPGISGDGSSVEPTLGGF